MTNRNLVVALTIPCLMFLLVSKSTFAAPPIQKINTPVKVLTDKKLQALGINPSEVKAQGITWFGVTSHFSSTAGLQKRYVVITDEVLYIVSEDDDAQSAESALPLSKIKSVELIRTDHFLFGPSATIEMETDIASVVFAFDSSKPGFREKLYSGLVNAGVRESVSTIVNDNSTDVGKHKIRTLLPVKQQGAE